MQVLAIAGGVQAIYEPSTVALLLGLGLAKLNLRYALLTTVVFVTGIVVGVPFSALAVELAIQRRLFFSFRSNG